ncbi:T9SS type A sorting domain-containing protein [Fulvivirgaceae bacterium PWU4]|uniref:T9SS type A sorting domain-containing protein n=1 Tax=Chryseosolibacter histidini TaxID=2782349 RepID=A0AAP2DK38_9BACT|nr:tail fiber domain-containing protein [Chryseosolibacter histidini]MBT1697833.1 T9SS type A sorting domain-containing protein [Chryseosolibacter histidini]
MKTKKLLFIAGAAMMLTGHLYAQNTDYGTGAGNAGNFNTSIGYQAGDVVTGTNNTFVGHEAGKANTTGFANSFIGFRAGLKNTTGSNNTFFGSSTGMENTTGQNNSAFGSAAGVSNTTGIENAFFGFSTGTLNQTGNWNAFFGMRAGFLNISGSYNVFLGRYAGFNNNGDGNVFIGNESGYNETSANNRLIINNGPSSVNPLVYGNFSTGQLGIGTSTLGTYALSVNGDAFATGLWVSSDKRFKKNEQRITHALEKINSVQGVNYEFNKEVTASRKVADGIQAGFIAQDLQKVFPELVHEDGQGYLAVNYQGMIPVLLEAIKDLSKEVDALKSELSVKGELSSLRQVGTVLQQNHPNPFNQSTRIEYEFPEGSQGTLYIFDLQGRQISSYPRLSPGRGELTIEGSTLQPGLYYYSLVVDGKQVDTKSLMLTR